MHPTQNENILFLVTMSEKVIDYETDPAVHRWLGETQFGEAIVANTRELCALCLSDEREQSGVLEHRWNLLKLALTAQLSAGRPHYLN